MKKTIRNLILFVVAVLLITAFAGCNQRGTPNAGSSLQINTIKFMPYAYLGESFDLRDVLLMEEGVEYSATGCFVEVKQDEITKEFTISETALEVNDLCFTPAAIAENVITLSAKRGKETASKVIYIPTTIHAEPLDDLFKSSGSVGFSDPGISKSVNINPQFLYGENSTTSLHVEFNSVDPHPWGNIFLNFSAPSVQEYFTDKTWENAIATFWVYNPNQLPVEFQFRLVDEQTGANIDFSNSPGANSQKALPGQWTQCFFPLRKIGGTTHRLTTKEFVSDMLTLKFRYDGYSTTEAYAMDFYIDNIDVVDASVYPEIDTKNVRSNEKLEQGWENLPVDLGWQGVHTEYDHEVTKGEGSTCALKGYFNTDKSLTNSFICLAPETAKEFNGNLDMTAGKLHGYFKFENMDAKVAVDIVNNKWATSNKEEMSLTPVGDGWYYAELDLQKIEVGNYRNDHIVRIRFHFSGVSKDSIVYMDTMKFDYKHIEKVFEAASTDWINMTMDTGAYYFSGEKSFSTSYLKGGNTVRSLMLKASANAAGKITWNTEAAAKAGEISATPNMNKGTLGAWFYFGKQLPNASFIITNNSWKGSSAVRFVFTKNAGDGWYYGEINASSIKCPEGGGTANVIRMTLQIPKGYTVYLDNLKWTPGVEKELVAAEIDPSVLYDGGDMLADTNTIIYEKRHWENIVNTDDFNKDGVIDPDITTGLTCGVDTKHTTGEYSVRSWYFKASADNKLGAAIAQLPLAKSYDMTGKNLSFDILVDTDCKFQQPLSFRLQSSDWSNINEKNIVVKCNPGEWKHVVINFDDVAVSEEKLQKLLFISIYFDFATTTGFDRAIYIDNVLLTDEEVTPPEEPLVKGDITKTDWTNMVQDVGSYYHASQVNEIDTSMHYGEESIKSLHFVSPEDKNGMFTLNPETALTKGEIEALPNLNEGMIGAWFYFGDQEPSAKIRVTDNSWKGSHDIAFVFNEEPVDGWYFGKVNCSTITYPETSNPGSAVRITLTIPAGYDIYVDNMTFDPTPVVVGPEWLYDGGDLLSKAIMEWNPAEWDGDPASYDSQCKDVYKENEMGAYSVQSWKLYTTKTMSSGISAQLRFGTTYDLTGKNLEFDVKFVNAKQTIGIELWNGWSALQPDRVNLFTVSGDGSEGWQTVTISAEEIATALGEKTCEKILLIRFNLDLRSEVEGEHAVYIDNLRFTKSDFFEVHSDLLANATAEGADWTAENGLCYAVDEENLSGEYSNRSWLFEATSDVATDAAVKFDLGENVDMTGKYLLLDVKTNAQQIITVQLLDEEGKELTEVIPAEVSGTDWEVALYAVAQNILADCDLTAVRSIVFGFDYSANSGADRSINIDNVRLVDEETAAQDMIQMPILIVPELTQPELTLNGQYVVNDDSVASVKMVAPENEVGAIIYDVSSLNLMPRGFITAWFYFGDRTPEVVAGVVDVNAKKCVNYEEFVFGEGVDGWYQGTLTLHNFQFEEGVTPGNIYALIIGIEPGTTVYIDAMSYADITETAADDMIHLVSGTVATIGSDCVYGKTSLYSLSVPAATGAKNVDFVPATALNFQNGKLTAWFYFGEATPGTVRFIAYKGASNSGYVTFTFGEGQDGWYLGTADMSNVAASKQDVLTAVDKFRIQVAKGADIYIDNLVFTANAE